MQNALFVPITPSILTDIRVPEDRAKKSSTPISQTMGQYGVCGPTEQAHFLGQILVESANLRYTEEVWGPTAAQRRYDTRTDLGNTPERDGDGRKYSGRGIIQVTGKDNYRRFQEHLRNHHGMTYDLVDDPSPVAEAPLNCMCAGWYWASHGISEVAAKGVELRWARRVTEIINGGHNHLKERSQITMRAYEVLLEGLKRKHDEKVTVFSPETASTRIEVPHVPL